MVSQKFYVHKIDKKKQKKKNNIISGLPTLVE